MQKTNNQAHSAHRQMQSSTTLSRKYVRRPARNTDMVASTNYRSRVVIARKTQTLPITEATQSSSSLNTQQNLMSSTQQKTNFSSMQQNTTSNMQQNSMSTLQQSNMPNIRQNNVSNMMKNSTNNASTMMNFYAKAKQSSNTAKAQSPQLTAKELKEQAIKKALESSISASEKSVKNKKKSKKNSQIHFGFGKMLLAISCATAAVAAIVYYVNINMPDMSLQVAALQTGIDASYPSYIPRDFSASGVTSEEGKVTMDFKNFNTGDNFTLVEETSSWDSSALEANYVKEEFGENYTVIREQGLTIYISGSDAAWVNGGVVFKLTTNSGGLTNKQIKSIAVSAQ